MNNQSFQPQSKMSDAVIAATESMAVYEFGTLTI